jgi:hypothetical protein
MPLHTVRILREKALIVLTCLGAGCFGLGAYLLWPPRNMDLPLKLLVGSADLLFIGFSIALLVSLPWQFRALRRETWRSEQRCRFCGYSMKGATGFQCPECSKSNQLR